MRLKALAAALAVALMTIVAAGSAQAAELVDYTLERVSAEQSTTSAGHHPDFVTEFVIQHGFTESAPPLPHLSASTESVTVNLPPGLVGNPNRFPHCSTADFVSIGLCPTDTQVGTSEVLLADWGNGETFLEPVYLLEPPRERSAVARLGFVAFAFPIFLDVSVRTASDYGVTVQVRNPTGAVPVVSAKTTIWGDPTDPVHDEQRMSSPEAWFCKTACFAPEGKRPSGLPPTPFLTNPSACQEQHVDFSLTSYQLPGQPLGGRAGMPPITGCEQLGFEPTMHVEPTNTIAGATTGLHAVLEIPQVEEVGQPGTSAMRGAKVTLPQGMTLAAGAANGLSACSAEQVGLGTETQSHCPDASKLGEVTITSPALPDELHGFLFQRTPAPGRQFRLWLVTDEFGLHMKLPGEIYLDPDTGQVTTEFKDAPQLPVEEVDLTIWDGNRAPLKNPDGCGTYSTRAELTPWSGNPPVVDESPLTIDQGCGSRGFSPKLEAGVSKPVAGAFSSAIVNFFRQDGEENIRSLLIQLPQGLLAKLSGVPVCGDAEAAAGSCPAGAKIGSVAATVGPGPRPLVIPQAGKDPTAVFLAGPYKGAPYSIVTKVPAQAGPFDLGSVLVRSALRVDPETAQASVESDPLPQFIEGVPVLYRSVSISVDRPEFAINPTSCEQKAFRSVFTSVQGAVARPGSIFQVGGCSGLGFRPKLSLKLRGGTQRGDYPAMTAILDPRSGDANIRRASVALPHSEFLAQEHIRTVCTRVQFAVDDCPKGSIYGYAKAWTPLLETPLEGPVYLRSSSNPLPDLVAALDGKVDIDLVGRIDSRNGGIRATFAEVPDAPVSRFVLKMRGGQKGLLVNSQNICAQVHRATVRMDGQNGRLADGRPQLRAQCAGKGQ